MTDTRTIPTIGRIVHYALSEYDAQAINKRILDATKYSLSERMDGAVVHVGNTHREGEIYPAMIVRTWGETAESSVQLQVFIDGNHTYWATSRSQGDFAGQFFFPVVTR